MIWELKINLRVAIVSAALLTGCSSTATKLQPEAVPEADAASQGIDKVFQNFGDGDEEYSSDTNALHVIGKIGSGEFVSGDNLQSTWNAPSKGRITLNFAKTDLRQVIKVVLGDILRRNYTIDSAVKGRVTMRTIKALDKDALLSVLESVLQMNGAALVEYRGVFKVMPIANAIKDGSPLVVGDTLPGSVSGYAIQIVPLKFVAAGEILKILEPLVAKGAVVRAQPKRNVLIMAAPRNNLEQMLETVRVFDVDYLAGMSFTIVRLQYAEAKVLIGELNRIFEQGDTALGVITFAPIERLNAILVLSKQPTYISKAKQMPTLWVCSLSGAAGS